MPVTSTVPDAGVAAGESPVYVELFAQIAEGAQRREQERILPREQVGRLIDAGIGEFRIPVDQGGAGASLPELFDVVIQLAAADANGAHSAGGLRLRRQCAERTAGRTRWRSPAGALGAQLAAAQVKVAVDRFSYATAARPLDVGGASATQVRYGHDRHWRNVRPNSTHNPTFLKATAIGSRLVNRTPLPQNGFFWR